MKKLISVVIMVLILSMPFIVNATNVNGIWSYYVPGYQYGSQLISINQKNDDLLFIFLDMKYPDPNLWNFKYATGWIENESIIRGTTSDGGELILTIMNDMYIVGNIFYENGEVTDIVFFAEKIW